MAIFSRNKQAITPDKTVYSEKESTFQNSRVCECSSTSVVPHPTELIR